MQSSTVHGLVEGGSSLVNLDVWHNVWVRFVVRRLLGLVGVLIVVAVAVFWLIRLIPGNPVRLALGVNAPLSEIRALEHQDGLDQSDLHQFVAYLGNIFRGRLGNSFTTQEPVSHVIGQSIGGSAQLAGTALVVVLLGSVIIGMSAAAVTRDQRHPRIELAFITVTSLFGAVPELLSSTVLAFAFAVELHIFPVAGQGGVTYLVLPAAALSLAPLMSLSRIVRIETLNALSQDYVTTAKGKRLPAHVIYLRHVLPNLVSAILPVTGLTFSSLIGGAVIVENIFNRAGIGTALVQAVNGKDILVVQGIVLVLAAVLVTVNAVTDLLVAVVDRRSLARDA
jgi:peptide/nickel transport system permease protein